MIIADMSSHTRPVFAFEVIESDPILASQLWHSFFNYAINRWL